MPPRLARFAAQLRSALLPRARARFANFAGAALLLAPCLADAADVFNEQAQISERVATPILGKADDSCMTGPVESPLSLFGAVERAMCFSPKTRYAWANVKAAASSVGISKAAYLPTLSTSDQYLSERVVTSVSDTPESSSAYTQGVNIETLSLGWVLYDFGNRSGALENSLHMLTAAQATQDQALQAAFMGTAKDYFAAEAAAGKVQLTLRIEAAAKQTLEAAQQRVSKGVAPITDQLQADTAAAQSIYERAKAEGDYQAALGNLAIDMSLPPDEPLNLPAADQDTLPDTSFVHAVHSLIEEAKRHHPSVVAAEAAWQAALAKTRSVRAQGRPTLQLVGQLSRAAQPVSASLGQPELPAVTQQNYIGVKLDIPLFEGFARGYQVRQAEAQAEAQEQAFHDAEQQVAIGVWSSYQTLQTDTDNLRNTEAVLKSAQLAFDAAEHRYQSGVGNILELLNAQSSLATAEQQRIQALADWRTARLQLAASLGSLGMWALS